MRVRVRAGERMMRVRLNVCENECVIGRGSESESVIGGWKWECESLGASESASESGPQSGSGSGRVRARVKVRVGVRECV